MEEIRNLPAEPEQLFLALLHSRAEVERLREREELFGSLLGSVNAVLWAFDWKTQQVTYVSPAYEKVFGRSAALLLADYREWLNSIYPDDLEYSQQSLRAVLEKGADEAREYRIIRSDGQLRWISDKCFVSNRNAAGKPLCLVGIAEDITEKKQLEDELQRLATTDVLTRSCNRRHFFDCAQREFDRARIGGSPLGFLLLDIDDFKKINDTYGHQIGDQVLQRIAHCGETVLRRGDLFGRVGGEEFAVILPGCLPELAMQIAERLQREVQRLLFETESRRFHVTVSQGLASLSSEDTDLGVLYGRADAAMYEAKRRGKNQIVLARSRA